MKNKMMYIGASIILGVILIFIFSIPMINKYFPGNKQMYCYFDKTIEVGDMPRDECLFMKVDSTQLDSIDFSQFELLSGGIEYECSENPDEIQRCEGANYYYTQYQLDLFCDDCDIDGHMCIGYHVNYYSEDIEKIMQYEELYFMVKFNSSNELYNSILGCEDWKE